MYKYTCPICNSNFERKNKGRKFCSMKCVGEFNKLKEIKLNKLCTTCNIEKSVNEFWKRKDSANGFHWQCKECEKKKRQTPDARSNYRDYARKKKRIRCGLDPNFNGKYKTGPKASLETKVLSTNGYWLIYRPGHPNAQQRTGKYNKGRIFEHIFIMSEHLGRPLTKNESIHHKNGIRTDNRIENLELWSKSQPPGQRVEDKLKWAKEFLEEYGYKVQKV